MTPFSICRVKTNRSETLSNSTLQDNPLISAWKSLPLRMSSPTKLTIETSVSLMTVWKSFVNSRPHSSSRDFIERMSEDTTHRVLRSSPRSSVKMETSPVTCLHFNSVSFICFSTVSHFTPRTQHLTTHDDPSLIHFFATCFRLTACPKRQEVVQTLENIIVFRLRAVKERIQPNSVPKILHVLSSSRPPL